MDNKTLEYMGERVDKARELTRAIKGIGDRINFLQAKSITSVRFSTGDNYTTVGTQYMNLPDNSIVSQIKKSAIELLELYRDQLQRELDEL